MNPSAPVTNTFLFKIPYLYFKKGYPDELGEFSRFYCFANVKQSVHSNVEKRLEMAYLEQR
jgi:hypothetical protein